LRGDYAARRPRAAPGLPRPARAAGRVVTALLLVLLLGLGVVAVGAGGAWMVRRSAPVLVRVPRLAAALLLATAALWVLTLLALGPMLSWVNDGPAVLTGTAGEVCQRRRPPANPRRGPRIGTAAGG